MRNSPGSCPGTPRGRGAAEDGRLAWGVEVSLGREGAEIEKWRGSRGRGRRRDFFEGASRARSQAGTSPVRGMSGGEWDLPLLGREILNTDPVQGADGW